MHNTTQYSYLTRDNHLCDVYPSTLIKREFQESLLDQLTTYTQSRLQDIETNIDFTLTLQLSSFRESSSPFLDANYARELKFRHNLLSQLLPTKTRLLKMKLVTDDLCLFCQSEPESLSHLFTCTSYPVEQFSTIIDSTRALFQQRFNPEYSPNLNMILSNLMDELGMAYDTFLSTPLALGVVNTSFPARVSTVFASIGLSHIQNKTNIALKVLDCWLSSFYHLIWMHRCSLLYDPKPDLLPPAPAQPEPPPPPSPTIQMDALLPPPLPPDHPVSSRTRSHSRSSSPFTFFLQNAPSPPSSSSQSSSSRSITRSQTRQFSQSPQFSRSAL